MLNFQITELCHFFIKSHITDASLCIDATAGNGNDTAFLCRLCAPGGHVLAFDIQDSAVINTGKRLESEGLSEYADIIKDSHCNMNKYASEGSADCIVFNLGYLPGGDHSVATKPDTSVEAIKTGLKLLKKNGIMSICVYSGGETGFEERNEVLGYLKTLNSKEYMVILIDYFNRPNNPPVPIMIIRL